MAKVDCLVQPVAFMAVSDYWIPSSPTTRPSSPAASDAHRNRLIGLLCCSLWKNRVKNGAGESDMCWVKPVPPQISLGEPSWGEEERCEEAFQKTARLAPQGTSWRGRPSGSFSSQKAELFGPGTGGWAVTGRGRENYSSPMNYLEDTYLQKII